MTKPFIVVLLVATTAVNGVLFGPSTESTRLNYWQMIPDAAIESCLYEHSPKMMQNTYWDQVLYCLYRKNESLIIYRLINVSGIISFFSRPMSILQWQWPHISAFTSYIYLNNKANLGFNLSFSGFTMGYSGSECVYDRMLIEALDGLTVTGQDRYCGIAPDWNYISLESSIRITLETTGEYTMSIGLRYGPVNSREYARYDNVPALNRVDQQDTLVLGSAYSEYAQHIIINKGKNLQRLLIAVHDWERLSFEFVGELGPDAAVCVYDGPFHDSNKTLFSILTGHNDNKVSLSDITRLSNGPVISVSYSRPFSANYASIFLKIQGMELQLRKVFLTPDQDRQISSDDYCPSVNGVIHCFWTLIAPRDYRPKYLFPNISNIVFTYKGPEIDNCLYGKLLMNYDFDFDIPVLHLCREELEIAFWDIVSETNLIIIVMYSYNNAMNLTFTAGLTYCHGQVSRCHQGETVPTFQLSYCAYIYMMPLTGLSLRRKSCNVSIEMKGIVGLKAKRGKWNRRCADQIRFRAGGKEYLPKGYMTNTSIEEWSYIMPTSFRLKWKFLVEIISNCQWSGTWLQIHAVLYCGKMYIEHLSEISEVSFSRICKSYRVPALSGTYRQQPVYTFPEFYNFKYDNASDWRQLDILQAKCIALQRNLCPSVHYISRDSRCPKDCVNDTLKLRSYFMDDYYTEMEYVSDLLNSVTFVPPQQRFRRESFTDKRFSYLLDTAYGYISNKEIYQYTYFIRRTNYKSHCGLCDIYTNIELPVQNSSYLVDSTSPYLLFRKRINPIVHLNRTKGIGAVVSYQTKSYKYDITSVVNASWLSANASCKRKTLSLLTMEQEDIHDILTDIYSTVDIWEVRKALPLLVFLGIQPHKEKVSSKLHKYILYKLRNISLYIYIYCKLSSYYGEYVNISLFRLLHG